MNAYPSPRTSWRYALVGLAVLAGCTSPSGPATTPAAAPAAATPAPVAAPAAKPAAPIAAVAAPVAPSPAAASNTFVAPAPVKFEDAIARAGRELIAQAALQPGNESRLLVIDPLIDANTGAQTVSTVRMGEQLESIVKTRQAKWTVRPLTRDALAQKPLLLIGTLTPVTVERSIDTVPDAFRVWLTMIDLRTGKVVAKQLDRSTVDSVNAEPLPFYRDSPTWHKDKTIAGYINSCQINTKIGDPADPDYLARLPGAAIVNEAIIAYDDGKIPLANKLYKGRSRWPILATCACSTGCTSRAGKWAGAMRRAMRSVVSSNRASS